jgi:predicted dehydrogenase
MLHYLGGHFLEVIAYLMGEVQAVSAVCGAPVGNLEDDPVMDDVSSVSLRFASGAVGTFHTGYLQPVPGPSGNFVQLWGTDGAASWPGMAEQVAASSRAAAWAGAPNRTFEFELKERRGVYGTKEWIFGVALDFVAGIREGRRPEVDGAAALTVLRLTDAAYEASRSGRWVTP